MQNAPRIRRQSTFGERGNIHISDSEPDNYNAKMKPDNLTSNEKSHAVSWWPRDYGTNAKPVELCSTAYQQKDVNGGLLPDGSDVRDFYQKYRGQGGKGTSLIKIIFLLIFFPLLVWMFLGSHISHTFEQARTHFQASTVEQGTDELQNTVILKKSLIQLKTLDPIHLPKHHSHHSSRLIVLGDVHGCKVELLKLLNKLQFSPRRDHLILAGDMIDKGPDSNGVIKLARKLGASCVRGNHEDKMLRKWEKMSEDQLALITDDDEDDDFEFTEPFQTDQESPNESVDTDDVTIAPYRRLHEAVLRKRGNHASPSDFSRESLRFLASCPVILRVGNISTMSGEVNVVHAGLVPNVQLVHQDPEAVMTMRTIDSRSGEPSSSRDGTGLVPWWQIWNSEQDSLFAPSENDDPIDEVEVDINSNRKGKKKQKMPRRLVVYGHDSKTGLNLQKYSVGLDTACVKGGKLSSLVIAVDKSGRAMQKIVSVRCGEYA